MLFTPWLTTFRDQVRARSRRKAHRRETGLQMRQRPVSVELLELLFATEFCNAACLAEFIAAYESL